MKLRCQVISIYFSFRSSNKILSLKFVTMAAKYQHSEILDRLKFPLYSVHFLTSRHLLVSGGGGSAKTGITNAIVSDFVIICLIFICLCIKTLNLYIFELSGVIGALSRWRAFLFRKNTALWNWFWPYHEFRCILEQKILIFSRWRRRTLSFV